MFVFIFQRPVHVLGVRILGNSLHARNLSSAELRARCKRLQDNSSRLLHFDICILYVFTIIAHELRWTLQDLDDQAFSGFHGRHKYKGVIPSGLPIARCPSNR